MKKLFLLLCTATLLWSCANTQGGTDGISSDEDISLDVNFEPHSFLMTDSILPEKIDLNMDISDMTMMELRLLRNYPYALKGLWFMEADVNGFFSAKSFWYDDRCNAYLEAHDWQPLLEEDKAGLSADEKAFVKRVDERIEELSKDLMCERNGLKLANAAMTVNMFQLEEYDKEFIGHLAHHNFAIMPTTLEQLFNIYEENDYRQMPNYITTDVFLQAYHMYFGYVLKSLEKHVFTNRIHAMNLAMYNEAMKVARTESNAELKDLAEFNATFFAVADLLLTGNKLAIPQNYVKSAEREISNIMKECSAESPLMMKGIDFNYDLFKPRGHYTRSEEQKRYFRSMMWLQTFTFCSEKVSAVKQASMMAYLLNNIDKKVAEDAIGVYKTLDFLMGEPDNVSVIEMADCLKQNNVALKDVANMNTLKKIDAQLDELFKTRNRITSKIAEAGCENKVNFMPQRYMPDSYVLSRTFDERPNSGVPFPRGLHVFSAFGVDAADAINDAYFQDAKNWDGYTAEMEKMKKEFSTFADWDKSMYNKWVECLVQLQKIDKDYPDYMKTTSWSKKNLNTALASWGELKHDAILYGEQPICAECGGGGEFPDPIVVGYVEPNLAFWNKMKDMVGLTTKLLSSHGLMTEEIESRSSSLADYMDFCIKVSKKEIAGQTLTEEEYDEISFMGSSIEWFTLSVLDPDMDLDSWGLVQGADRSVAVVADVMTRNVLGCDKCGILTEATGNADEIYVTVNIGGKIYLTRGAVFSYYEFVNPLNTRFTDEEWQEKLEKGDAQGRQDWMLPLIIGNKPKPNETIFYSSGC